MHKSLVSLIVAVLCGSAIAAETTTPLSVPSADKTGGITLQLSEGWKTFKNKDGSVSIEVPKSGVHIEVKAVEAASVDEAVKQMADLIKGWVTKFTSTESKSTKAAGADVKVITGTGEEADDGDPSNAEVYVFAVDGKVYLICAHGEGDGSVKNRPLLHTLLESVKKS